MLFIQCLLFSLPLASVMGGDRQRRGGHFPSFLGLDIGSDKKDKAKGRRYQTDHTATQNSSAVPLTHGDLAGRHGGPRVLARLSGRCGWKHSRAQTALAFIAGPGPTSCSRDISGGLRGSPSSSELMPVSSARLIGRPPGGGGPNFTLHCIFN